MTDYNDLEQVLTSYEHWLLNGDDDERTPGQHARKFIAENDPILILLPPPGHEDTISWGKLEPKPGTVFPLPEPPTYKHDFRMFIPENTSRAYLELQDELDNRALNGWEIVSVTPVNPTTMPNHFYITSRRPV